MGLLDEAIRDHLELKRRRGADAGEIAHAERAALAPVFPDEPRAASVAPGANEQQSAQGAEPSAGGPAEAAPVAHLADETAEIDMQAVLAQDDAGGDGEPAAAPAAPVDDGFEWEVPADREQASGESAGPPEQIPGQERMSLE